MKSWGYDWLASKLRRQGIAYQLIDSALVEIDDWKRAQQLSNGMEMKRLQVKLDQFALRYCLIHRDFGVPYHWSVDQCEYATDVVFKRQADLAAIYGTLTLTAIHAVRLGNIATFLGKRLSPRFEGESGNRYNIRIVGTQIKHTMGPVSVKLYDRFSLILRIETTVNDHFLQALPRGRTSRRDQGNQIGAHAEDHLHPARFALTAGSSQLALPGIPVHHRRSARAGQARQTLPAGHQEGRCYPGFNLFDSDDDALFQTNLRGEFNVAVLQNKSLRRFLPHLNSGQILRLLKRMRLHGLIKKVAHGYKY